MKLNSRICRTLPLAVFLLLAGCACENSDVDGSNPKGTAKGTVIVNNEPLSSDQIAELEATYQAQVVPGEYWYDAQSGLFGTMGMPSHGQLYPGHELGTMPADASKGTSGVFLNGRQLTESEVQFLAWFTGPILPGRYWMDGMSTVGYEGNPTPVLNLYYLMAQQSSAGGAAPAGGGDNGWSSMYGSGNYSSDGSSGYVHLPSATGGSGTFVSY